VVQDASGRHRRHAGGPLSTDELLAAPTTSAFPAAAGPGWAPDPADPWAHWDAPPPVTHPDHPSASVPRVRAPQAPTVRVPAGNAGQDHGPSRAQGHGPVRQAVPSNRRQAPGLADPARWQADAADGGGLWLARQVRIAGGEAAAIRQAAEQQAAAIRQAAEQEAAELRAAVIAMSTQMGHVATYLNDHPGTYAPGEERPQVLRTAMPEQELVPGGAATRLAWPALESGRPEAGRSPSSRTPRTEAPSAPPDVKPAGRQAAAMRKMAFVFAALLSVAVTGGLTEIGLHGFSFFVFRSAGTGATDNNGLQENQGPGQPDAPGAHHAKSAKVKAHHKDSEPRRNNLHRDR
jgi:hypothetical protein